jgi:hypothetical protein
MTLRLPLLMSALILGGCAAVAVRPEGELPKPLVVAIPSKVAVVVTNEAANYVHKESRASVDYEAQLGPSHRQIVEEIFRAEFREAKIFPDLDAARAEPGIHAIFEPRIEQFSFASARETGGAYCAVTIRYQIFIYAPDGQQVDVLTLTGYGSGPAPKIGNGEEELGIAAYAAMRDAAAKFLTQFQGLDVAKPLLASQTLAPKAAPVPGSAEAAAAAAVQAIEALPINETPVVVANTAPAPATTRPTDSGSTDSAPADPAPSDPAASPPAPAPASDPATPPSPKEPPPSQMAAPYPATSL